MPVKPYTLHLEPTNDYDGSEVIRKRADFSHKCCGVTGSVELCYLPPYRNSKRSNAYGLTKMGHLSAQGREIIERHSWRPCDACQKAEREGKKMLQTRWAKEHAQFLRDLYAAPHTGPQVNPALYVGEPKDPTREKHYRPPYKIRKLTLPLPFDLTA